MNKLTLFALLALGAWTFQSCDNSSKNKDTTEVAEDANEKTDNVADDDGDFVVTAASGGMFEVEASKLAQEKSQNARVKEFADMMVKDHTKANDELKTIAGAKGVVLPSGPGEDHQEHLTELRGLSGADFDKKYVDLMVDDHKKDIKLFEEAADDAKEPELAAFASKTLPVIKQHAEMINGIKDGMK